MATNVQPVTGVSHWSIDPAHTSAHFKVRHMVIAWVRGEFRIVRGTLDFNDHDLNQSKVEIDIDASSIFTR